jgi:cation transport ATPase
LTVVHDSEESPAEPGAVPSPEEVEAELVAAGVQQPDGTERRYPSTIGGAFYLGILAVVALGLGVTAFGHWRGGVHLISGALVAAAVLRLVLPARDAGMLAVRHRALDCSLLATVGVVLWVLASTIPDQAT